MDRKERTAKYYRGYKKDVYRMLEKRVKGLKGVDKEDKELFLKEIKSEFSKRLNPRSKEGKALSDYEKARVVNVSRYHDKARNIDIEGLYKKWKRIKEMENNKDKFDKEEYIMLYKEFMGAFE